MKTDTKEQIFEYIKKNRQARAHDIGQILDISQQIIHRHLKDLIASGLISKVGSPPKTFYVIAEPVSQMSVTEVLSEEARATIDSRYLYVTPDGHLKEGVEAFIDWAFRTGQKSRLKALADEYAEQRQSLDRFYGHKLYIDAKQKFIDTFPHTHLSGVYYADFYSLPKFGKTSLGSLVLVAKQSQSRKLIYKVAQVCQPIVAQILRDLKIDTIAWVPHSLPRKIQFLKELRQRLDLGLPEIAMVKAYPGDIPIAQKTLSKLEERIENAERTLFIKSKPAKTKNILIIDDAVGSGATLNAAAEKINAQLPKARLYAFAAVGSFKGFEVIREI